MQERERIGDFFGGGVRVEKSKKGKLLWVFLKFGRFWVGKGFGGMRVENVINVL